MRSTFRILFYINKNKVKADGTTAILCRISIDGKQTVLTTGIYCKPDEWNAQKGIIRTDRENNKLIAFRQRLEETYRHILKEQGVISSELLKNTITGVNSVPAYLLEAGKVELERLRVRSIEINSTSTYRQSKLSQLNLQEFLYDRGIKDIAFADIHEELGESFKIYLKTVHNRKPGYINKCLTWLNRLIYIAVDQEVLRSNPLEEVSYEKKEPARHRYISKSDLKRIMETPMSDPRLELVRRVFIFSSLTGLAYVDMQRLYPKHIGKTSEGRLYIRKQRVKTKVEAFIPLHPIAGQILFLYNTTDENKPVFPLPVRDKIWYDINQIGVAMGLKENLSYHQSRHSFGTLAISAGLSIESIARMMGHANISTTQGYAQITEQKISQDMDKLIERRKIIYK
ncbi:site-specific integrase [Dysgonomonas sp. Marseille-P4677]|uniref:site-specific integrase n=1 Tax=Dysgonomonas sp. Marseille-P4677 TaxID=2364790 RepID=UPI001913E4BD|nr:site-specific integrase [Dysgonomonas sp. Marseille-P4677]MBK5722815.1 site-specific integrase [Dysgonomonas sp. Marseille-P4677]